MKTIITALAAFAGFIMMCTGIYINQWPLVVIAMCIFIALFMKGV